MSQHKRTKPNRHKGAALVEYVILMAIIGVTLISVVLSLGVNVTGTYTSVASTIQGEIDIATGGGSDTDGGGTPTPDPTVFPDPPTNPSGIVYNTTGQASIEYENIQDYLQYDTMVEGLFASQAFDNPTPQNVAADAINWEGNFNATSVTLVSGDPNDVNEMDAGVVRLRHNIGPLPGWGPAPASFSSCQAFLPGSRVYEIVGYNSAGDRVEVALTLDPYPCSPPAPPPTDHYAYRQVIITHNGAGAGNYGAIANAELAGITSLDWTTATWDVVFLDQPTTGQIFSGLGMSNTGYVYNQLPGPAWQDADSGYSSCYEGGTYAYGDAVGTHPDGETVTLSLSFESQLGDTGIPGGDPTCFEAFGGP